jgi:Flp pilus assembly secretin CpaC
LKDIPLLGALFSSTSSTKQRNELLVLMRPTVLRSPEEASLQAKKEEDRLPGVKLLDTQDAKDAAKQVAADQKLQQLQDEQDAKAAAKAKAKALKSGKTNSVPVIVTPATMVTPPVAPSASAPTASAPKSVPAASTTNSSMPYNPAAGLF